MNINQITRKRFTKALSITTSVTTTLWMSGAAMLAPIASHAQTVTINDGEIFRASNDFKVYIAKHVGAKKFKRWFVGPQMFDFYKHLSFAVVKVVDPAVAASYTESMLTRVDGDTKVWHIANGVAGVSADKHWVSTLAAFTTAGFDWDSVYVINSAEGGWYTDAGIYGGGPAPTTTPVAGMVSATLATNTPAGAVLAASSQFNPALRVTFTAPSSGSATITGLTLTKYGLVANTGISGVSVWDSAGKRHGSVISSITSDNKVTVGFGTDAVTIAAGMSETLTVSVSLGSGASSGTVYFGVSAASDVSANTTVGGAFPLTGNLFTLASGSLGNVQIDAQNPGGSVNNTTANVDVSETQKEVAKFRFTQANGNEDISVESVTLYVEGDITEAKDVLNWKLYDPANNVLATAAKAMDRYITLNLATPYKIEKGLNRTLSVKADFVDGANRWVRVHIQNDYDVMVRGKNTGALLLPIDDGVGGSDGSAIADSATTYTDQTGTNGYFLMRQGTITITKTSGSPSGQLAAGASDALLAKFTLRASGEDMEARKIDLHVISTDNVSALTGNVSLRSGDGSITYLTTSAATGSAIYADSSTRFDLSTYIQLKSNTDTVLNVYGNVSSSADTSDGYTARIRNVYVKRLSSIDFTDLPDTTTYTAGNNLSVVTTAATVAKNTAYGDSTIPPSLAGAKIGSFVVQGGVAEDSRISSINLIGASSTSVSNMVLKVGGVQQGVAVGTPTLGGTTYSVSINVPKSTPVTIDIHGDVKSNAANDLRMTVAASGLTIVGLSTSNTVSNLPTTGLQLQTITFAAGSLEITKDSSSPVEQILTPANGVLLGHWKFEAKNEELTLAKLTFTVRRGDGSTADAPTANYGTLSLKDGSTTLATGSLVNQSVVFSGFSIKIAASGSKILSLYADLTGSGTQTPNSIAVWTIASDTTPTDIDVTGSAGQLAPDDIDTTGSTSGANTTFATSTRFLYHNSKPVIAAASNTPSGSKTPGAAQEIFIFTVTNTGTRDMRIGGLTVTVSASGGAANGTISDFDLYDGTQKIADEGTNDGTHIKTSMGSTSSSIPFGFGPHNAVSNYFDNFVVSAGASKTLTLKVTTTAIRTGISSGSQNVFLNAKVSGTTGYSSGTTWNPSAAADKNFTYFYTPVFASSESGPFYSSDSYPVNGGTLTY